MSKEPQPRYMDLSDQAGVQLKDYFGPKLDGALESVVSTKEQRASLVERKASVHQLAPRRTLLGRLVEKLPDGLKEAFGVPTIRSIQKQISSTEARIGYLQERVDHWNNIVSDVNHGRVDRILTALLTEAEQGFKSVSLGDSAWDPSGDSNAGIRRRGFDQTFDAIILVEIIDPEEATLLELKLRELTKENMKNDWWGYDIIDPRMKSIIYG